MRLLNKINSQIALQVGKVMISEECIIRDFYMQCDFKAIILVNKINITVLKLHPMLLRSRLI